MAERELYTSSESPELLDISNPRAPVPVTPAGEPISPAATSPKPPVGGGGESAAPKPAPAKPPSPAPKPKSQPMGTDVVTIPKDATPVEKNAQGEVSVYAKDGVRYYTPASGMYDLGFRTSTEFEQAWHKGLGLGYHETEGRVGPNSVVVEIKGELYRVTPQELKRGDVSRTVTRELEKGNYRVPVTAVSEKSKTAQLLLDPKDAARLQNLTGEARFDFLQKLGVLPTDMTYSDTGTPEYSPATVAESRAYKYKRGEGYDIIGIIKDKALTDDELDALFGKSEADQWRAEARQYTGKVYDYDSGKYVWAKEPEIQTRDDYYKSNPLVGPPGTKDKITPAQFETRRAQAESWLSKFQIEPALSSSGEPEYNWLAAGKDKDADKHLKYLLLYDDKVKEVKEAAAASEKLDKYSTPDGYDIARFLRFENDDTDTLKKTGFNAEDIEGAQDFNRRNYGAGAPDYEDRKAFIRQNWKASWGKLPYTGLIAEGTVTSDKAKQAHINELNAAFNEQYRPEVNASEFARNYFADKGWEYDRGKLVRGGATPAELLQYDKRLREATDLYVRKFGGAALAGSGAGTLGYVVPAARAFNPNVRVSDISGMEWAVSGAIVALAATGGAGSALLRHGVRLAAGGAFTLHTVENWGKNAEAGQDWANWLNLGITAMIFAPYIRATGEQIKNIARGGRVMDTKAFMANEAQMAAMSRNVEKYYGKATVEKLNEVYDAQTALVKTVKVQDELAAQALKRSQTAEVRLREAQKALTEEMQAAKTYSGGGGTDVPARKLEVRNASRDALRARQNYETIIEQTPVKIQAIEDRLGNAWDSFKFSNKGRPGFDDVSDLYSRRAIVEYTRNLAESLAKGNPKGVNITQLQSDLNRVTKELAELKEKYPTDPAKWRKKVGEQMNLEAKIISYRAGNAETISKALTRARQAVKDAEKVLRETRSPDLRSAAERAVREGKARVSILEDKYRAALKGLKVESTPGEAEARGRGRVLTKPPSTRPSQIRTAEGKLLEKPPETGGGVRSSTRTAAAITTAVSKQVIPDAASGEPLEIDSERIRRIATEAGTPEVISNPSIRRVIEEEYRKAMEYARANDIDDQSKIKPVINAAAITDALNRAQAEGEFAQSEPQPQPKPEPQPQPQPKPAPTPTPVRPKTPPPEKPRPIPTPSASAGKQEKKWTEKEAKSAVAWKDGVVVHAIKSPYRRGIDEATFSVKNLPAGLRLINDYSGPGSQQRSVKVTGRFPNKLTVDVGNQDVILTRTGKNRVRMRHVRDTRGTISQTTIKRNGRNISRKIRRGVFSTNIGGGQVLSHRPLRGY